MRQSHPVFSEMVDPSEPVWRYFDFPKFVSLLEHRAIFFSRADLLGDPMEGSYTKGWRVEQENLLANPPEGCTRELLQSNLNRTASLHRMGPQVAYVNCWHLGAHESMAMWQGYGNGPFGIAIRSTFGILDSALPEGLASGDPVLQNPIYLSKVRYLDHSSDTEHIPHANNLFSPLICKSIVYRHENEIRAIFFDVASLCSPNYEPGHPGHFVPADLTRLVQSVTISPLAPNWFKDVVQAVCQQFGFEFLFVQSIATTTPIF